MSETEKNSTSEEYGLPLWLRVLLGLAALVIIVAGMKAFAGLLVPFLLAIFLAIISTPALLWMQQKGVRPIVAILIVTLLLLAGGIAVGSVLANSIPSLIQSLPQYSDKLHQIVADSIVYLKNKGIPVDDAQIEQAFRLESAAKLLKELLSQIGALTAQGLLIFLILVLILLEAATFEAKLRTSLVNPRQSMQKMYRIANDVKRYLAIKSIISLITAVLVTVWMLILGVDYAILWGLLTFVLTYVPNIGAILSAVPPALMALIQMGSTKSLLVLAGYAVVCGGLGNVLELLWMGQRLGLSTLVVFLSMTVWAWIFGPVGVLLAIPLTMAVKIVLQSNDDTRWIAILLGSGPEKTRKKKTAAKQPDGSVSN